MDENLPIQNNSLFSKIKRGLYNVKQNVLNYVENNKVFSTIKNIFYNKEASKEDKKEIVSEKSEHPDNNDFNSRLTSGVQFDRRINQNQTEASKQDRENGKTEKDTDDLTI